MGIALAVEIIAGITIGLFAGVIVGGLGGIIGAAILGTERDNAAIIFGAIGGLIGGLFGSLLLVSCLSELWCWGQRIATGGVGAIIGMSSGRIGGRLYRWITDRRR